MIKSMKPGSVIVDLAAVAGGNCSATKADKVVVKNEINIVGYTNIPSRLYRDVSLVCKKYFRFSREIWDAEKSKINMFRR